MKAFLINEVLPFFLASLLLLFIGILKIPVVIQQAMSLVIMVVLIVLFGREIKAKSKTRQWLFGLMIFLSAFFIQLLIYSTGVFLSPFLILLHIFTISLGLIRSFRTSLAFLFFSVSALTISILTTPILYRQALADPGILVLYISSFVVILPLTKILAESYHFKELVLKKLSEYSQITVSRESFLLGNIAEYVVVTDQDLKIMFFNEMMEKALGSDSTFKTGKNLFEALKLLDSQGNQASRALLSIDQVMADKTTRVIKNFDLYLTQKPQPIKVSIQVHPIVDTLGNVTQLVFILKDESIKRISSQHPDLEKIRNQQKNIFQFLENKLTDNNQKVGLTLFQHGYEDLLLTQELEDHQIIPQQDYIDIALLISQLVKDKADFAKNLGVNLELILNDPAEESLMKLNGATGLEGTLSGYSVVISKQWFNVFLTKIIEMLAILVSQQQSVKIDITAKKVKTETVEVDISTTFSAPQNFDPNLLLQKYYGKLMESTNLKFSSGLEGFIAKTIADQLKIPIKAEYNSSTKQLLFTISLSRELQPT